MVHLPSHLQTLQIVATATVLITAAVFMNTKKIGTKYLMGLMSLGLINKDVTA